MVNLGQVEVGIIVDRVSEVRDIDGKDIDDPPSFGTNVDSSFILGMGKSEERVSILLDITKVLGENKSELANLNGAE